jgi:integrase
MSVRKRKWTTRRGEAKEAWIVDYIDQDGARHIETFKRKKEADAYAQQVGVDVRSGTHTPVAKSISVATAAADWLAYAELEGRERATVATYRQHVRHITDRIGSVRLASLTTPRINAFRDDLLATMSRPLARKVLVSLKSILRDAQRRGNVAQNVALGVSIKGSSRAERRLEVGVDIPATDEVRAFIGKLHGRWRPLFLTAIFCGLRASELRGLRWQDVDLKAGELHVRQRADRYNAMGMPKSKAGGRRVPLPPHLINVLREWRLQSPHELVFATRSGMTDRLNNIARGLHRIMQAAGITRPDGKPKYTGMHALRHFFASWCINPVERGGRGLPPKVVQEILGHASIVMTMDTYGHLFPRGDDAKEFAAAERALLG